MTRANTLAGIMMLALIAVAPIPFGGNLPLFWTASGFVAGCSAILYMLLALGSGTALRVAPGKFAVVGTLWLLLCLWLVVQALPLGKWLGGIAFANAEGDVLYSNSLSLASGATWLMLIRVASYGVVFFLAAQAGANESRVTLLLKVIFWIVVAHAGFGLVQLTQLGDTLLGMVKLYYQGVATGTFINRNSYATFLAMGMSIGAALLARPVLTVQQRNHRPFNTLFSAVFTLAGMLVMLLSLLATESRMGLFAGIAGVLGVTLLTMRWSKHAFILIPVTIAASLLIGVTVVWIFGQGVLERAIDLAGSTAGRMNLYEQVWRMIGERPLLGYGGGAFDVGFPLFFGPPLPATLLYDRAHSTYLTLLSELGVVFGLIPIAVIAIVFARAVYKFMQRAVISRLATIGVITAAAIHSTVDFSLEMQANAYFLAVIVGLSFATSPRKKQD